MPFVSSGTRSAARLAKVLEERSSSAVNDTRFYGPYHRIPALCYGPRGENHHSAPVAEVPAAAQS